VLLKHAQGLSVAEVCARTGRSPAAVAGLLRRGLERLRHALPPGAAP
jgi:DNA-directed RNA polymerase specialized sigma24 family protein